VDRQSIRFSNPKRKKRFVYLTSPIAAEKLVEFDQGKDVQPFEVSMSAGYSETMRSKTPGFKRSNKRNKKPKSKRRPMPSRYREYGARVIQR